MNKHTPGPWWYDGRELIKMPEHIKVAGHIDGANPDQKDANIRLIGNSPEMYKALQKYCALVENKKLTTTSLKQLYYDFQELLKKIDPETKKEKTMAEVNREASR